MAREVVIKMTDDLDRTLTATEVREVGYAGSIHVIDLTAEHAQELDELLAPYLGVAHEKVKWSRRQINEALKTATSAPAKPLPPEKAKELVSKEKRQKMRAWGRRAGFNVSDRGYLPKEVQDAYAEAHKGRRNA